MGEMNPKHQAHKKQTPLIMEFQISELWVSLRIYFKFFKKPVGFLQLCSMIFPPPPMEIPWDLQRQGGYHAAVRAIAEVLDHGRGFGCSAAAQMLLSVLNRGLTWAYWC